MIKPIYSFFSIILALACLYGSELVSDEIATPSRSTENYEHWVLMCNNINAKDENQLENQLKFCEIKTTISVKNQDGNPVPLINVNVGKPQKSDDYKSNHRKMEEGDIDIIKAPIVIDNVSEHLIF